MAVVGGSVESLLRGCLDAMDAVGSTYDVVVVGSEQLADAARAALGNVGRDIRVLVDGRLPSHRCHVMRLADLDGDHP